MPKVSLVTPLIPLVSHFLANGHFITAYARSVVRLNALKELQTDLPLRPWPVAIVTLKNRTLSPVVERFIECAREVTKSFSIGRKSESNGPCVYPASSAKYRMCHLATLLQVFSTAPGPEPP